MAPEGFTSGQDPVTVTGLQQVVFFEAGVAQRRDVDGRGGGKPEMAQAGGQKPEGIDDALAAFSKWAQAQLS